MLENELGGGLAPSIPPQNLKFKVKVRNLGGDVMGWDIAIFFT